MNASKAAETAERVSWVLDNYVFDREEFLSRYWHHQPGEHVTILGPTGSGKTYLGYQLLEQAATPERPAIVLVVKPRDATVAKWSKTAGFRTVRSWPPPLDSFRAKPPGYVLWPKHAFDPAKDEPVLHVQCRAAILDSYKQGDRIIFADEVASLVDDLGLKREFNTMWKQGRSMGTSVWAASQRPRAIPLAAYSQAAHLFLHNTPDKADRDRFAEIGGVDPDLLKGVVAKLDKHQFLYVQRDGPHICVLSK